MRTNPFRSMSDDQIESMLHAQGALWHAFAHVRPTDALMTLARKTLAWSQSKVSSR